MAIIRYSDLSDFVIANCNNLNFDISNKKLQKLMYYCQAWHLALSNKELISDDFEAWIHGAVLRPLYCEYEYYGFQCINLEGDKVSKTLNDFINKVPFESYDIIMKVLNKYVKYSADELEEMNHSEYPWIYARNGKKKEEKSTNKITKDVIREYYAARALEEEMKTVKNNVFKITSSGLKAAQKRLNERDLFKPTVDNYKDYENFIVETYRNCNSSIKRAEYGYKV